MKEQTPVLPLDGIYEQIDEAVNNWKLSYSPGLVGERVKTLLDNNFKEIVLKLMGFDNTWHRWELRGDTFIAKYLQEEAKEAAIAWLNTFDFRKIKVGLKTELTKKYQDQYERAVYQIIQEEIEKLAAETVEEIMIEITNETVFDKRRALEKILTREHKNE